jgi:hypothetical protein
MLSTTHMVSHSLREIESALRAVLRPAVDEPRGPEGGEGRSRPGSNKHELQIRAILEGLDISETDPVAKAWLQLPGKDSPYNLASRAHRNALDRPRPVDPEFRQLWNDIQDVLDAVLDRFEARFTSSNRLLDELLAKGVPTDADLSVLKQSVPNNSVSLGYFFDRLESVSWLQPLKDEGFFRSLPDPVQDYEQGGLRFVGWPQSTYLAKMVELEPATVKEILLELPPTDNVRVYEELVDVACELPIDMVAELVPKFKEWIHHRVQWALPDKLSDTIVQLAQGGQVNEALDLSRELFALLPRVVPEREYDEMTLPETYQLDARFDDFLYAEYLDKCSVPLVEVAGERALMVLSDLLEDALYIYAGCHENRASGCHPYEDPLHITRPAIEGQSEDYPNELENPLISAVRDAADRIAESDPESVPRLVQIFEHKKWRIFDRLAMYLLRRYPDAAPELVAKYLTDRRRFDERELRREYALLARSNFAQLEAQEQTEILSWIEDGPDLEGWKDRREESTGSRPTDEDAAQYAKRWRRDHLALLGHDLPMEWKKRYDELVAELGQPTDPEFVPHAVTVWEGPQSPKTAEELTAMSVEDIIAYLDTWQPSGEFMASSPDDLAQELSSVVAQDPERFASAASNFRSLDPTYVRWMLNGLREAVKQGRTFSWSPILALCSWIAHQPREIPGRQDDYGQLIKQHDLDPDWGWTRKAIADLLVEGFAADGASIPFELREDAWTALYPLTEDPEPDAEYETRYGGSNMDPATMSINTTRGEAMHAVVRYALWVRRGIEGAADVTERLDRGLDEMPEVRDVLDQHLDPDLEPSLAIRALYGWRFPQLTLIDKSWAAHNARRIFPADGSLQELRAAAWGAYVVFEKPYDEVVDVLLEEYSHAVRQLSAASGERWMAGRPDEKLVEHLMMLYWSGKLGMEDSPSLILEFYGAASDELCAYSVEFLTSLLENPEVQVSEDILARLRDLWDFRREVVLEARISEL